MVVCLRGMSRETGTEAFVPHTKSVEPCARVRGQHKNAQGSAADPCPQNPSVILVKLDESILLPGLEGMTVM